MKNMYLYITDKNNDDTFMLVSLN